MEGSALKDQGSLWGEEAAESKAVSAPQPEFSLSCSPQCLVLNETSKHNVRSYKNVLIPVGALGCYGGRSDGIFSTKTDYWNMNTYIHSKCNAK